jgi:hypothetical protein
LVNFKKKAVECQLCSDKEMIIFKQIQSRITQFDDIENKELAKIPNYKQFSNTFHFEILKFKIEWINLKESNSSFKRGNIFVLIIEMLEKCEFLCNLSSQQILEYLKIIETNGFTFIANDLKSKLFNLNEFEDDLLKTQNILPNSHSLND